MMQLYHHILSNLDLVLIYCVLGCLRTDLGFNLLLLNDFFDLLDSVLLIEDVLLNPVWIVIDEACQQKAEANQDVLHHEHANDQLLLGVVSKVLTKLLQMLGRKDDESHRVNRTND